jgi:hypothetical protein
MTGAYCRHVRLGIITNQPESLLPGATSDKARPLCSVTTCERPECIKKYKRYVAGESNETAYYVPDADRTVRR